jgi:hypothetical protein
MKIIRKSNFDKESVSDKLVCGNVNRFYGMMIVGWLNNIYSGPTASDYYRLVEDDYVLYESKP